MEGDISILGRIPVDLDEQFGRKAKEDLLSAMGRLVVAEVVRWISEREGPQAVTIESALDVFKVILRVLTSPQRESIARCFIEKPDLPDQNSAEVVSLFHLLSTNIEVHEQEGVEQAPPVEPDNSDNLTSRESEVLKCLAAGKTNAAIATELVISVNTVQTHIQNIFAKTSTTNRTEAAKYAFDHHLDQGEGEAPR